MNALHRTSQKLVDEAVELYHHVPDLRRCCICTDLDVRIQR